VIEDFDSLTVSNLSRHYGRRKALSKVTFTCHAGDIVGLLGPNGAGKSTLLSILGTLLAPSEGRVEYGSATAESGGAALRSRIGMLGHDLFLYGDLTARENLEFFGRLHRVADLRPRVDAALQQARLEARGGDRVAGFSRGMRQRLALERALLHEPRLVLLDEPFTGLDDESSRRLVDRLSALRSGGAIIIVSTHDLEAVEGLVNRVAVLREGRLAAVEERPTALRDTYRKLV
jgi:heme exporter protein A